MFNITTRGMKTLKVTQSFNACDLLAGYTQWKQSPTDDDLKTMSEFEYILELTSQGWGYEWKAPSKKVKPYNNSDSTEKTWYYQSELRVNKTYLHVLMRADKLFERGLVEIHHFQKKKYYECLLRVPTGELNAVQPWHPDSYYKVILQKLTKPKSTKTRILEPEDGFSDFGQMFCFSSSFTKLNSIYIVT